MARVQPDLNSSEQSLLDQLSALTHSKRTDVIKSALTAYHWLLRQTVAGADVIARKPSGEEVALETAEMAALRGRGRCLSPTEIGRLASDLASASGERQAARLREQIVRGFYGL